MTFQQFNETIVRTGCYDTPGPVRFRLPPFLATPVFILRMFDFYVKGWLETFHRDYASRYWARSSYRVLRAIERTGGEVHMEGYENVRKLTGPAVVTSNHASAIETYLFPLSLIPFGHNVSYVLKSSLRHYPLLGRVVRAIRPIEVDRKSPIEDLRQVMQRGTKALEEGRHVLIFPQGSRFREFDPRKFNTLGTKLAMRAHCQVLPCCVSMDFWRIGKLHRDLTATCHPKSPVRIAVGEPIETEGMSQAEIQKRQLDFIQTTLSRWEQLDHRTLLARPSDSSGTNDRRSLP